MKFVLLGCSHGTYALIGATLVHSSLAIFSKRTNCTPSHGQFSIEDETFISLMTRFFFFNAFLVTVYSVLGKFIGYHVFFVCSVTLLRVLYCIPSVMVEYCYFPTASTSYAAHICGFLTGVAVTFLLHWTNKPAVRWCSDSEMTPVPRVRTPFLWKIIILVVFSGTYISTRCMCLRCRWLMGMCPLSHRVLFILYNALLSLCECVAPTTRLPLVDLSSSRYTPAQP